MTDQLDPFSTPAPAVGVNGTILSGGQLVATQLVLPWDDLAAKNIPETFLPITPELIPTLSALIAQGPNGPRLLRADVLARLIVAAQINDITRLSGAVGIFLTQLPVVDSSAFLVGDLVRVVQLDATGAAVNSATAEVGFVAKGRVDIGPGAPFALSTGDLLIRLPAVSVAPNGYRLLGQVTAPQNSQAGNPFTPPVGTTTLAIEVMNPAATVASIRVQRSTGTGPDIALITAPTKKLYVIPLPFGGAPVQVTLVAQAANGTALINVYASVLPASMQVVAPPEMPINVAPAVPTTLGGNRIFAARAWTTLVAARSDRRGLLLVNNSNAPAYISYDGGANVAAALPASGVAQFSEQQVATLAVSGYLDSNPVVIGNYTSLTLGLYATDLRA